MNANIDLATEGVVIETVKKRRFIGWWKSLSFLFGLFFGQFTFKVKILTEKKEREQAYRLRGLIFGKYPEVNSERDCDSYDKYATLFGVFSGEKLCAVSRIITAKHKMMLEDDFSAALKGRDLPRGRQYAEITRMATASHIKQEQYRVSRFKAQVAEFLLYRCMYRWARQRGIRYWYFNVEPMYFRKLRRFFGFEKLVDDYYFNGDKVPTCTVIGDLKAAAPHLMGVSWLVCRFFVGLFYNINKYPQPPEAVDSS